jgi:hypothetical protein
MWCSRRANQFSPGLALAGIASCTSNLVRNSSRSQFGSCQRSQKQNACGHVRIGPAAASSHTCSHTHLPKPTAGTVGVHFRAQLPVSLGEFFSDVASRIAGLGAERSDPLVLAAMAQLAEEDRLDSVVAGTDWVYRLGEFALPDLARVPGWRCWQPMCGLLEAPRTRPCISSHTQSPQWP